MLMIANCHSATHTRTDAVAATPFIIANALGSGVCCDKLFGRADRVLKHLALAHGPYAERRSHQACKGRGEATTTRKISQAGKLEKSKRLIRLTLPIQMKKLSSSS